MVTTINFHGVEFEITDTGSLVSKDGRNGSASGGGVGIQIHQYPLDPATDSVKMVASLFIKPDEARLLASALLSAATSVQSKAGLR